MLRIGAGVRLVKGAYREPPSIAFPAKADVDANYGALGRAMLDDKSRGGASRVVFGTHDTKIVADLCRHAHDTRVAPGHYEFHMLYGIQRGEQQRLAAAKEHIRVLIAYGTYWFPWYMRRLAERPANVWFVVKSVFG
jgi:proline dehydrogenase